MKHPAPAPSPPPPNPALVQWLMLGAALLMLGGAMAFDLYQERGRAQSREEARLLAQTRVIQESIGHNLKAIDKVLLHLRAKAADGALPSTLDEQLTLLVNAMPGVRTLIIFDETGTIRASNRPEVIGKNFSERAYFQTPLKNPDADMRSLAKISVNAPISKRH